MCVFTYLDVLSMNVVCNSINSDGAIQSFRQEFMSFDCFDIENEINFAKDCGGKQSLLIVLIRRITTMTFQC